jgi:hypothetical protein
MELRLFNMDNKIKQMDEKISEKFKLLNDIELIKKQDINNDDVILKKTIPKLDLKKSKK